MVRSPGIGSAHLTDGLAALIDCFGPLGQPGCSGVRQYRAAMQEEHAVERS